MWIAGVLSIFRSETGRALLLFGVGALVTLAVGYGLLRRGERIAYDKIQIQDQEAVDAARKARNRVDMCRAAGGVWSQTTGQCRGR